MSLIKRRTCWMIHAIRTLMNLPAKVRALYGFKFLLLLIGGSVLVMFIFVLGHTLTPDQAHETGNTTVIKPANDWKKYKFLQLKNGLKVMLVESHYSYAGAGFCVGAGGMSDREGYDGLAHYTEHAIFSGSKKYPPPGYLVKFVERNDGSRNAMTSLPTTSYKMTIKPEQLKKGLDVFADMFKQPLWNKDHIDKEKVSVQNELERALSSSYEILYSIQRRLADPEHNFNGFDMGSKKLFDDKDYIPMIKWFYKKYYSASMMSVVIVGPQSLQYLQNITEYYLNDIPNNNQKMPTYYTNPYPAKYIGQEAYFYTPSATDTMVLTFPIAWTKDIMDKLRDTSFIDQQISSSNEGGLEMKLRSADLAYYVYGELARVENSHTTYEIKLTLTAKGICERKTIIKHVFEFVEFLKKEIGEEHWKPVKDEQTFRFEHKSVGLNTMLTDGCEQLLLRGPKWFLRAPDITETYDPKLISYFFGKINPGNMNIILSLDSDSKSDIKCSLKRSNKQETRRDKHMKTTYYVQRIPKEWKKFWISGESSDKTHSYNIHPVKHTIPQNLTLLQGRDMVVPETITYEYGYRGFWLQSAAEPKIWSSVAIHFGDDFSARRRVVIDMAVVLARQRLQEEEKIFDTLGVSVTVSARYSAIVLSITGYSDYAMYTNITRIAIGVLVKSLAYEEFESVKSSTQNYYLDDDNELESTTSLKLAKSMFRKDFISNKVMMKESDKVTRRVLEDELTDLYKSVAIKSIVTGNLNKKQARELTYMFKTKLGPDIKTDAKVSYPRVLKLPLGRTVYQTRAENTKDLNNFVSFYWQLDPNNVQKDSLYGEIIGTILGTLIHSQAYSELRSKQQIGYFVRGRYFTDFDVDYFTFSLQGSRFSADEMTSRALAFLEHHFRDYLQSCVKKGTEEFPNKPDEWFDEMAELAVSQLTNEDYNANVYSRWPYFNKGQYLSIAMESIVKEDLMRYYDEKILSGRTLIIQIHAANTLFLKPTFNADGVITNMEQFKEGMTVWEQTASSWK